MNKRYVKKQIIGFLKEAQCRHAYSGTVPQARLELVAHLKAT
jgi:hypothetical protein